MEEDDEEARKLALLASLKQRLANGEHLTAEELALLEQLENDRLMQLEKLIAQMMSKGYANLSDLEKLELIDYKKERCHILIDQIKRKKSISKED